MTLLVHHTDPVELYEFIAVIWNTSVQLGNFLGQLKFENLNCHVAVQCSLFPNPKLTTTAGKF